jgi:hypothetical protein
MTDDNRIELTERMNQLAAELTGLSLNDPRRAEIVNELTRLSLLSAYLKGRPADG